MRRVEKWVLVGLILSIVVLSYWRHVVVKRDMIQVTVERKTDV
jgi:hypothetical protein